MTEKEKEKEKEKEAGTRKAAREGAKGGQSFQATDPSPLSALWAGERWIRWMPPPIILPPAPKPHRLQVTQVIILLLPAHPPPPPLHFFLLLRFYFCFCFSTTLNLLSTRHVTVKAFTLFPSPPSSIRALEDRRQPAPTFVLSLQSLRLTTSSRHKSSSTMNHMGSPPLLPSEYSNTSTKRKRSISLEPAQQPTPPAKVPKPNANHLQINYLVRQYSENLPLISADDPLPSLLSLISDYDGVLQRHESMASNLGAKPLGPILVHRFERLFDGPPRVLKTHGKEGTTIGWLDVVDFAKSKPEQFNLEKMRDGVRVCQFYTKQCRVEISEDDYVLIASGIPQNMIPPQPIREDEEKELGTLEILEKNLGSVVQLADQVSARARQLKHTLKRRKNAILSRREAEAVAAEESRSPSIRGFDLGQPRYQSHTNGDRRASESPTSGFTAVNSKHPLPNERPSQRNGSPFELPRTVTQPTTNGMHGASAATRAELMSKFQTSSERATSIDPERRSSIPVSRSVPTKNKSSASKPYADSMEYAGALLNQASPVPIPNTPTSLLPHVKPSPADRYDDSGPYKADMMARMEQLSRGDRVQPPCDRCRRLHMDCLKNLTACLGCTKKHAKCSWNNVEEQELRDHPFVPRIHKEGGSDAGGSQSGGDGSRRKEYSREEGVRDEELLGEDTGDEDNDVGNTIGTERQHSVQSQSAPTITLTKEPGLERVEKLPPPVHSLPTPATQTTTPDLRAENSTPSAQSAPTPYKPRIAEVDVDKWMKDSEAKRPTPPTGTAQFQAPEANMSRPTLVQSDGINGPSNSANMEHIYSQLSSATRDNPSHGLPAEHVRVYIAGSEPIPPPEATMADSQPSPVNHGHPTPPLLAVSIPSQAEEITGMSSPPIELETTQTSTLEATKLPSPPLYEDAE